MISLKKTLKKKNSLFHVRLQLSIQCKLPVHKSSCCSCYRLKLYLTSCITACSRQADEGSEDDHTHKGKRSAHFLPSQRNWQLEQRTRRDRMERSEGRTRECELACQNFRPPSAAAADGEEL